MQVQSPCFQSRSIRRRRMMTRNMQAQFPFPSCFSSGNDGGDENDGVLSSTVLGTKLGQSVVLSVYRTKIAGQCRLIAVTWCKNPLIHGLSVKIEELETDRGVTTTIVGKVEVVLWPWNFWRRQGSKQFNVEGKLVDVIWDLRSANFTGEPEPSSGYYVAVVSEEEVVLALGDLKKEAFRRSGSRPSPIDAILVSKKEHVFGKKKFSTKAKFHERGKTHEISILCSSTNNSASIDLSSDLDMSIRVDGQVLIQVKHLQWKFRGNGSFSIGKIRVQVYWDVHDWIFEPGLRNALFIFKPTTAQPTTQSQTTPTLTAMMSSSPSLPPAGDDVSNDGSSDFCLFLYAWKLE